MEKVRFDINKFDKVLDKSIEVDGKEVKVCSWLPEKDKEELAQRLAYANIILDDENEVAITPYNAHQVEAMVIVDVCSDIDVDWVETEEDRNNFVDFLRKNNVIEQIELWCEDLRDVREMAFVIVESIKARFEKQHSVVNQIMDLFALNMDENEAFESAVSSPEALTLMRRLSQKGNASALNKNEAFNLSKRKVD